MRRLKNWKIELSDEMLAALMKKYQKKTLNAFYAAVGKEEIDVFDIRDFILAGGEAPKIPEGKAQKASVEQPSSGKGGDDILVIDAKNVRGLDYKMSKCCNPVFGDDVFGFVSRMDGIKIHRMSCPNAARLMNQYPYRIQKVRWSDTPSSSNFQVALKVSAAHDPSVVNEIMDVINSFRASMRSFSVNDNTRAGTYDILLKVAVPSNLELDKVISRIRALRNVIKVSRG